MATTDKLIITAAEYQVAFIVSGTSYNLTTLESIETNVKIDTETFHAIGSEQPIGEKRNNRAFSGKLTLQFGELLTILKAKSLIDATRVVDATLSIANIDNTVKRTWTGMNINTEAFKVGSKDKQTLIDLDWTALNMS